ncbi:SDR family NAD(P)-dependent oxidoreductase [Paracoccus sediminicola]|uniref:SDR family NAD(P)-dependent oxidoreductase n=1 Tax=Paracoccus sediminicola TaxID=3017783 RepID=UPI0022F115A1|nr:SDR family oxidoreductase [Paracoccus sediminicola]WBU56209.1 SDR family oxidoreductase [Paracoccus sediminicola]
MSAEVTVLKDGLMSGMGAVVSGAGTGIGRAIALRLCQLGMDVTGIGRREDPLKDVEKTASSMPGSFRWKSVNVRESEKLVAKIAEAGEAHGIDLLVNNAGGQFFAPATNISKGGWEAVIDLNLTAVFAATKAAYPFLKERQGAVVNMSLSGVERGSMGLAHSVAARAGVLGMTRSLALEWAGDGIRLNCIGPGTVVTAGLSDEAAREMLDTLLEATPMHMDTKVEEVAELTAFLASPAGRMMTGQLIQIDGGAHIGAGLHMIEAD